MTVLVGVAHGSKDDRSQQVVRELLAEAAARRPGVRALPAYVDNASPSVRAALGELAARGETDVVVLPLLLTAASHSKTDVAGSVQEARAVHPGMRIRYGRPLGPHRNLIEALAWQLGEAGARNGDPVVLAAAGSLDPDANAQVAATARLLWEGRTFASVDAAFASTTGPTVPQVLERLRLQGFSHAVVARFFLGPGRLPDLVARQARSVPGLEVLVTEPLGVSEDLVDVVVERYDEALGADLRMNCDVCQYRVPFPGREAVVGAPQVPHTHPDDPADDQR
jgi:sirohydrochlorin cobaltochelatase